MKVDKRSKAYRDSKKVKAIKESVNDIIVKDHMTIEAPKELGTKVKEILEATGVAQAVKYLFGEDCGCDEREQWLNKLHRKFKSRVLPLSHDEYNALDCILPNLQGRITHDEQKELLSIYRRIINPKQKATSCSTCWQNIVKKLSEVYAMTNIELNK